MESKNLIEPEKWLIVLQGFCSTSIGWRWSFWVGLSYAGISYIAMFLIPETFAPELLRRRACRLRQENPGAQIHSALELGQTDFAQLVTRVITRPIRMMCTELIVAATCMYLALCYGIFYMSFQAFPLIYQSHYGLSPGVTGLCFLPISAGAFLAVPIFYLYDIIFRRAQKDDKNWARHEEYRRVPLACLGGPMFVIALFWLGWSTSSGGPLVAPLLAGIPFGVGWVLVFVALQNYLIDAYGIYAASASAALSTSRSIVATALPLATAPMFARLGIAGACSLLGGLSLLMCPIPFIFICKGQIIRERSKFCIALQKRKEESAQEAEHHQQRKGIGPYPADKPAKGEC